MQSSDDKEETVTEMNTRDPILTSVNEETGKVTVESDTASIAPDGPFKVTIEFGIVNEAEEMHGYAKCTMPMGKVPTGEDVSELALRAMGQVPDGFRFMTREEFLQEVLREHTGTDMDFAIPERGIEFKLDAFK